MLDTLTRQQTCVEHNNTSVLCTNIGAQYTSVSGLYLATVEEGLVEAAERVLRVAVQLLLPGIGVAFKVQGLSRLVSIGGRRI